MNKRIKSKPSIAMGGPWLADEPSYAAMQVKLTGSDTRLIASVTALDGGTSPMCTLAIGCEHDQLSLELIAAMRIREHGTNPSERPDLAMFLADVIGTEEFRIRVLAPFVVQMQECGMY